MPVSLMSICGLLGAFGLAALASAASSPAGHGGGGAAPASAVHSGGAAGGGAAHEGAGHASARFGSRIPSIGPGTREGSKLAKMGLVDAYNARIGGHDATVAVIHRAPLTATERDQLHRYHFKGFNECVGHEGCSEQQPKAGEEMYCRTARNVAITHDLECLSFQP
jgi:hypothetical protein